MDHSDQKSSFDTNSFRNSKKKRSPPEVVAFLDGIRANWYNVEKRTAELLEARLESGDWECSKDITLDFLGELEGRLVEISEQFPEVYAMMGGMYHWLERWSPLYHACMSLRLLEMVYIYTRSVCGDELYLVLWKWWVGHEP